MKNAHPIDEKQAKEIQFQSHFRSQFFYIEEIREKKRSKYAKIDAKL